MTRSSSDANATDANNSRLLSWSRLLLVFKLVIIVGTIWVAAILVPPQQWLLLLDHPGSFLGLVGAWAVNQLLCAGRLWVILRSVGYEISLSRVVKVAFSSFLVGSLLPGVIAQDLAKMALLQVGGDKTGAVPRIGGLSNVLVVVFADRVMGLLSLWIAAVALSFVVEMPQTLAADLLVHAIRLSGLAVLAGFCIAIVSKLLARAARTRDLHPILAKLTAMMDLLLSRRTMRAALLYAMPLSLLAVAVLVLAQATVGSSLMTAIGQPSDVLMQAFLAPTFLVVSALPLAPLGIGIGQVSLAATYEIGGLDASSGVLLATFVQLAQITAACFLGLPVLAMLRLGSRRSGSEMGPIP